MHEIIQIKNDIAILKKVLLELVEQKIRVGDWITRDEMKKFFNYSDTQLRQLETTNTLKVAKIGRRKFYHVASIEALLESHSQHDSN